MSANGKESGQPAHPYENSLEPEDSSFAWMNRKEFDETGRLLVLRFDTVPLTILVLETKIAEFANNVYVDLDEVAHNEPPSIDLHCLPSSV